MQRRTIKKPTQIKQSELPALRETLLGKQGGLCAICKRPVIRPCVDHQHKKRVKGTGLIRGVVCSNCNVFLAKSENNCTRYGVTVEELPNYLRNMANYLEKPHLPFIHPSEAPKPKKLKKSSYNKLKKVHTQSSSTLKFPDFPASGKLVKQLEKLFQLHKVEPEFYK